MNFWGGKSSKLNGNIDDSSLFFSGAFVKFVTSMLAKKNFTISDDFDSDKLHKLQSHELHISSKYLRTDAVPAAIFIRDMFAYWALALARCTAFASTAETLLKLLAKFSKKRRKNRDKDKFYD